MARTAAVTRADGANEAGTGGERRPASAGEKSAARAASAADDVDAPGGEGRATTDADLRNARHSDPPVWRDTIDDVGGESDDADDASVSSDGGRPPDFKKSKAEHDAGRGLGGGGHAAASDDEALHMDRGVFEDRMLPGDGAPAEDEVAAEFDRDAVANPGPRGGDAGRAAPASCPCPRKTAASTPLSPARGDAARHADLQVQPRPGAPACQDSQARSGAGDAFSREYSHSDSPAAE